MNYLRNILQYSNNYKTTIILTTHWKQRHHNFHGYK